MNILILDSFLREYVKTDAKPKEIAKYLSLTSVSVERIEKLNNDYLYDIEITANRVDLMSVMGLARELAASLSQNGFSAKFNEQISKPLKGAEKNDYLSITVDKQLVNRVSAAVMEVKVGESPVFLKERLERMGIRSLNNLVDVTNYIMRDVGHPAHVFDYDRLKSKKIIVRESNPGEFITTLDDKKHTLKGGDIVAEDEGGRLIDLLGVMGLKNSVVTDETKRIVLFFDNNNPKLIRKTSMGLSIRSEAAIINEKGVDPELITPTLQRGIELYEKYASGKLLGKIIDIYPNKPKSQTVKVRKNRISKIMGITISEKEVKQILEKLSFKVTDSKDYFEVSVPSFRLNDIKIEEDITEEVARIYGYDKIPNSLPKISGKPPLNLYESAFYWEEKIKDALKYWGFNEVYTYSMVSEDLFEGPLEDAVKIANPLSEDHVYMRATLVPSLLEVLENNYSDQLMLFELVNVYLKRKNDLPDEKPHLAGVIRKSSKDIFFSVKGILEALMWELGVKNYSFRKRSEGGAGADIFIGNNQVGNIELLEENVVNFEIDFQKLIASSSNKKIYKPIPEYPPVIEDIRVELRNETAYEKVVKTIESQSDLITKVELLDEYEKKMTFRVTYQDKKRSLSNEDVTPIREKLIQALKTKLRAKVG